MYNLIILIILTILMILIMTIKIMSNMLSPNEYIIYATTSNHYFRKMIVPNGIEIPPDSNFKCEYSGYVEITIPNEFRDNPRIFVTMRVNLPNNSESFADTIFTVVIQQGSGASDVHYTVAPFSAVKENGTLVVYATFNMYFSLSLKSQLYIGMYAGDRIRLPEGFSVVINYLIHNDTSIMPLIRN